tara:strand:+ start:29 stop:469 length:441 start_codon:yes stop_codon:yes gene_type:complete
MLGKIYKITPHECCEFYIGSTWDMEQREIGHRIASKNNTYKIYEKIRECGGFDMEVLYEYECENENELHMEEQRCMDKLNPTLNSNRAYRSDDDLKKYNQQYHKQYAVDNKEKQTAYIKQYRIDNKNKRNETQRKWRQMRRDKLNC